MKRVFEDEIFLRLKKFIVSVGVQPNADRCNIIPYNNQLVTVCCNSENKSITICEGIISWEGEFTNFYNYLLDESNNLEYLDAEKIEFYNDVIEPNSECCDYSKQIPPL